MVSVRGVGWTPGNASRVHLGTFVPSAERQRLTPSGNRPSKKRPYAFLTCALMRLFALAFTEKN